MASGSQNMTTYNARTVTGSNSAASPAGALLLSGANRANDATGDTWIFFDSGSDTSTPWGIKHDQANNKIHIYGNNTDSVWTRMDTGDTYILGKVGIGYNPETSGNSYKLYVNGGSYFIDTITGDATSAWHILGGRPTNTTNFNTHFETVGNLHHDNPARTDVELTYNRFFLSHSDQTNYGPSALHLPVIDQHVLSFGIDNGATYSRHMAFDIRTNAVYVRARTNDGWGNWEQLVRNTGTWGISITGNAATATKATQDGSGNTITSYYCTLTTAQTITGTKSWGTSGAGGQLNGAATNGGINSIRIGDDVWLGDCNAGGIMGMKSTGTNCGFYMYNSSGTQIGQLYFNGTNLYCNKTIEHPDASVSYIAGAKGSGAALYAKKTYNQNHWYPAVALETKGGGAWQIGNYDDETLEFQYATKANRDANTNSTSEIYMQQGDTGRVLTSGNYTNWTVTKTGSGASGTWGINITGTASGNMPWFVESSCNANSCAQGFHIVSAAITNAPTTNHGALLYVSSVGTPFQIFFPDNLNYVYKRWYTSGAWTAWHIMNAAWA